MIALAWKEARELAPGALLMLLAMAVVAIADAAVNAGKANPFPFSVLFAWLVTLLVAAGAGASAFARERPEQLRHLNSWPISRGRIAAVKVLTAAGLTILTTALIVAVAEGILALGGVNFWREYRDATLSGSVDVHAAVMLMLFCHTLAVSALVRSPAGVLVLGPVVGLLVLLGYAYITIGSPAARFGPSLGLEWSWVTVGTAMLTAAALALAAAAAGVWGHTRTPIAEGWLRLKHTAAAYGALAAIGSVLVIGGFATGRSISADEDREVAVDPTGRHILVAVFRPAHRPAISGLWLVDPQTGNARLIARGPISSAGFSPEGERVFFDYGTELVAELTGRHWDWVYDIPGHRQQRIALPVEGPYWRWFSAAEDGSPRGTYIAAGEDAFISALDGDWAEFAPPAPYRHEDAAGWTPNDSALYWTIAPDRASSPEAAAFRTDAPAWHADTDTLVVCSRPATGTTEAVASLPGIYGWAVLSPDARYIALAHSRERGAEPTGPATTILDLETLAHVEVDAVLPRENTWIAPGDRLWCHALEAGKPDSDAERLLIDAASGRAVGRLKASNHAWLQVCLSPDRTRMLISTRGTLPTDPVAGSQTDRRGNPDDARIYALRSDGTDCTKIFQTEGFARAMGYTHDGEAVVKEIDGDPPQVRILRIGPETGSVTTLLEWTRRHRDEW